MYNNINNHELYYGFYDHYESGVNTPTFIEQNLFEINLANFNEANGFGYVAIENWTRSTGTLPKVKFAAECMFSYAALMESKKFENDVESCDCETCDPKTCKCLEVRI